MTQAFERVRVDYVVAGGARIWWDMARHFVDPGPYTFQLQVGHTGVQDADDWANVGSPLIDTYMTFDNSQRLFGKTLDLNYRVQLTTTRGTYYSEPQQVDGLLSKKDWINYRELTRKEMLRHRVQTSVSGFLLKARRYGPRCTVCADQFTEEVTWTNCITCYGTGFLNGYFEPLAASYADLGLESNREHRNPNVGMEKQDIIEARFVGDPQLYSYDVWINGTSDERYYIHGLKVLAHVRGVTLLVSAELRHAPYTDVIYKFPLDGSNTYKRVKKKEKAWRRAKQTRPGLNYLEAALKELKERRNRSSKH